VRAGWLVLALTAVAVLAASASAEAPVDIGTPIVPTFHFGVAPTKLSRTHPTHVTMSESGQYRTTDGSHVPALRELELEGDRHLALDLKDVPVCRGRSGRDGRGGLEEQCRDALLGSGKLTAEIAFPESALQWTSGKLHLYNGGRGEDGWRLLALATLTVPTPSELIVPITIRKIDDGRFGWRASAAVPKIAGGSGSIYGYSLRISKRFLTATCRGGRLQLRALSSFADGSLLSGRAIQTCTVAEPDVRQ